jgi:WD40 repeat protein
MFATESADAPGTIEIRDATTAAPVLSLGAHSGDITGLAFSPDGAMLASTGDDGELNVWDASTGDPLSSVDGDGAAVSPTFDLAGSRVAAAWEGDRLVRIATPTTGGVVSTLALPAAPIADIVLSPDLRRVGYAHEDDLVVLDLHTRRRTWVGEPGFPLSWSPDGRSVAVGWMGVVHVLDAVTLRERLSLDTNEAVYSIGWSADAHRVVVGGDTTGQVWHVERGGGRELMTLPTNFSGGVVAAAFSPDGSRVIARAENAPVVKVWDISISGDAEVANIPATVNYADVAFMPHGAQVAVQLSEGDDPSISIWDLATSRSVRKLGPPGLTFGGWNQGQFEVSPDGTAIATLSGNGAAAAWDAVTNDELFAVPEADLISWVDWSPDGSRVVMSSLHGWAKVFDRSGRVLQVFRDPERLPVWSAIFTPDGRSLVTDTGPSLEQSDLEGRTIVWDVEQEKIVVRTISGAGSTWSAISPTGDRHVTVRNGQAEVWDLETGTHVSVLAGADVVNVDFGPRDRVAGAMLDATVRLYDATTGAERLVLRGHENTVAFVDFSPDGSMLISGAADRVARVWALDIDLLLRIARDEVTRSLTTEECRRYQVDPCS